MGNFSRGSSGRGGFGGRSGGRPGGFRDRPSGGFGGRSGGFRGRDSGRPIEHHNAICSKCGAACQVPFRPTGTKPVLCAKCFRESGIPRGSSPSGSGGSGVSQEQFKQLNAKLDKILSILKELEIYEGADDVTEEDEEVEEEEAEPKEKAESEKKAKPIVSSKDSAADDDDDEDEEEEGTDEVEETDEDEPKSEDIKE